MGSDLDKWRISPLEIDEFPVFQPPLQDGQLPCLITGRVSWIITVITPMTLVLVDISG